MLRNDILQNGLYPFHGRQWRLNVDKIAVDSENDRISHLEVHVRGATFHSSAQNALE
jgi:hypothetical protein